MYSISTIDVNVHTNNHNHTNTIVMIVIKHTISIITIITNGNDNAKDNHHNRVNYSLQAELEAAKKEQAALQK